MKKKIFFSLSLLWMIIVFLLSNQIGNDSGATSGRIVKLLTKVVPFLAQYTNFVSFFVRKLAHFTLYALGGVLYYNLFKTYRIKDIKSLAYSEALCTIYAVSDEIHQFFVPGRECHITDIFIDSLGAFTGILFMILVTDLIKFKRNKKCKEELL